MTQDNKDLTENRIPLGLLEPERVTVWVNVYPNWASGSSISRANSDNVAASNRIGLWRITYDKDTGLNPVIEVEGKQDDS